LLKDQITGNKNTNWKEADMDPQTSGSQHSLIQGLKQAEGF